MIWEKNTITFTERFDCPGFFGSKRIFNQRHNSRERERGGLIWEKPAVTFMKRFDCPGLFGSKRIFTLSNCTVLFVFVKIKKKIILKYVFKNI